MEFDGIATTGTGSLSMLARNWRDLIRPKGIAVDTESSTAFYAKFTCEPLERGFGITLDESLHAAEYLASEGNQKVIFGLRGMKTNIGDPHRNLVDFAHVPVVKSLTRMPVCIDPSHSVGGRFRSSDRILDIMHITAQGVIAGANMVLVDFHPDPSKALVDGPQALRLEELPLFLEDVKIVRQAYQQRVALYDQGSAA